MNGNICPVCGAPLPAEAINLSEGVALCPGCGRLSRLSDVVEEGPPVLELLKSPPGGCTVADLGREIRVRASLRSVGGFFGTLFAAVFWNGIVSVFLLFAIAGLYTHFIGPLPDWFPAPSSDSPISLGPTLFLCLFLTPFVLIGLTLIGSVLLNAAGRVEAVIGESSAVIRTGVWGLVWRQRFDPQQVHGVKSGLTSWETNGKANALVVIEADKTIKFGSLLRKDRREWLQVILKALLVQTESHRRSEMLSSIPRSKINY